MTQKIKMLKNVATYNIHNNFKLRCHMGLIYPCEFQFLSYGRPLTTYNVSINYKFKVTLVVTPDTDYYFDRFFANALTEHKSAFVFFVHCLLSNGLSPRIPSAPQVNKKSSICRLCLYNIINIDSTDTLTLNICNFILRLFFLLSE